MTEVDLDWLDDLEPALCARTVAALLRFVADSEQLIRELLADGVSADEILKTVDQVVTVWSLVLAEQLLAPTLSE